MKKNVVFMACVQNKEKSKKYGDFDYFDYSIKTWEYWCKLNDCPPAKFQMLRKLRWQECCLRF